MTQTAQLCVTSTSTAKTTFASHVVMDSQSTQMNMSSSLMVSQSHLDVLDFCVALQWWEYFSEDEKNVTHNPIPIAIYIFVSSKTTTYIFMLAI